MGEIAPIENVLALEQIEVNLFRGRNLPWNGPRIFGGQVIAQALAAAYKTVESRFCHSLQAYFIRPGDSSMPTLFEVERSRDGKSFTTRRVIAIQKGEQIFNLAASFQVAEPGFEHQTEMPSVPPPEALPEENHDGAPEEVRRAAIRRPVEMRYVDPVASEARQKLAPLARVWFRAAGELSQDVPTNQAVLAYASDMALLSTSMRPHGVNHRHDGIQVASLDHIMWFHRPSHASDWHLYVQESPNAIGARGLNFGAIYARDGQLVASVAQEGLIRPLRGST